MKKLNRLSFRNIISVITIFALFVCWACAKQTQEPEIITTTTMEVTTTTTSTTTTTTTIDLRDKNNLTLLTLDQIEKIDNEVNRLSSKNHKAVKNRVGQSNWNKSTINDDAKKYGVNDVIDFDNEKVNEIANNIQMKSSVLFTYGSFGKYVNIDNSFAEEQTTKSEELVIQESLEVVKQINNILSKIPEESRKYAKFMVVGYTDSSLYGYKPNKSQASWDFNKDLSEKRANTVKEILVNQFHVNENNISSVGMSFANPILDATGAENQNASRRTEILVSYE